jgi:hypothetical protein
VYFETAFEGFSFQKCHILQKDLKNESKVVILLKTEISLWLHLNFKMQWRK